MSSFNWPSRIDRYSELLTLCGRSSQEDRTGAWGCSSLHRYSAGMEKPREPIQAGVLMFVTLYKRRDPTSAKRPIKWLAVDV